MQDLTAQEVDQFVSSVSRMSGGIGRFNDFLNQQDAESRLRNDLYRKQRKAIEGTTESVVGLTRSFKDAVPILTSVLGGGLFAKAIGSAMSAGAKLTESYRELAATGNTFGGSILKMQQSAAEAGMPLDDFAEATKKASLTVANMNRSQWPAFQKQLRQSMIANGNFAMSVEDITDFTSKYLEVYRLSGSATKVNAKNMTDLAETVSTMSIATGKATTEISNLATSALEASNAGAALKALPENIRGQATTNIAKVTSVLAAQAGAAGDFMTNAFADTVGKGNAIFTEQGKQLAEVGLGGLISKFDKLSKDPTMENAVGVNNDILDELGRNYNSLKTLAASGNATAAQMLKVYENGKKLDLAQMQKEKLQQDNVTKFFNTIRSIYDQAISKFKVGFLDGMKPFFAAFGDITKSGMMEKFGEQMGRIGTTLGKAFSAFFTEERMKNIGDHLSAFGSALVAFNWSKLFEVFTLAAKGVGMLTDAVLFAVDHWKEIGLALGTIFAAKKIKGIGDFFSELFGKGKELTVNTVRIVMEGGGMGGDGGGSGNDSGGSGGGDSGGGGSARSPHAAQGSKLKRKYRQGYLQAKHREGKSGFKSHLSGIKMAGSMMMDEAKKAGGKALEKGAFKTLGKEALKSGLKKIPIIGALTGVGFAAQRAMSGDWLGAGMELASGVAGTIPGIGTAASLGIDAALAVKDGKNWQQGIQDALPDDDGGAAPSRSGGMKSGKGKVIAGVAGAAAGAAGLYGMEELLSNSGDDDGSAPPPMPKNDMDDLVKRFDLLVDAQNNLQTMVMSLTNATTTGSKNVVHAIDALRRA